MYAMCATSDLERNNNKKDLVTWNYCNKRKYESDATKITIIKVKYKNKVYENK